MIEALIGAQFLGHMMKTGGCPQPPDIKNMVKAAEVATVEIWEAEGRRRDLRRKLEAKHDAERHARMMARYAVTENCMAKHPPEAHLHAPRHKDGCLSNRVCEACCQTLEAMP